MERPNVDPDNGIRFGVIPRSLVMEAWEGCAEYFYPETYVECQECGTGYRTDEDIFCWCGAIVSLMDAEEEVEPCSQAHLDDGYKAHCGIEDGDIWIEKSDYYTYAPLCSPCAPNAGYLGSAHEREYSAEMGFRTYCFDHEWFDGGKAPYPVFRVSDNEEVKCP